MSITSEIQEGGKDRSPQYRECDPDIPGKVTVGDFRDPNHVAARRLLNHVREIGDLLTCVVDAVARDLHEIARGTAGAAEDGGPRRTDVDNHVRR